MVLQLILPLQMNVQSVHLVTIALMVQSQMNVLLDIFAEVDKVHQLLTSMCQCTMKIHLSSCHI